MRRALFVLGVFTLASVTPLRAHAEGPVEDAPDPTELSWAYLYDGLAIPFVFGSALVAGGADRLPPRATPLWFSADEGGEASNIDQQIPPWAIGAGGAAMVLTVATVPRRARWFHVKGMVEALLTTTAMTSVTKVVFGRHRPDYVEGGGRDESKSFFSGHTSATFSATTYFGLYLSAHVFPELRGDSTLPWWEVATYAALTTASLAVPYERVAQNRHHPADVAVGAFVGTATSALFFWIQQVRFEDAIRSRNQQSSAVLVPALDGRGAALSWMW